MAIAIVPYGSIWTTWDDDDWRSDDYLEIMTKELLKHPNKKFLMYCNRLEHNMNTDFTWRLSIKNGTYIFFCFKCFDPYLKFDDIDNKEDVRIKKYLINNPDNVVLYDNPRFNVYIRFSHDQNTSSFVNKHKKNIATNTFYLKDSYPTIKEQKYVSHVKNMYYT